MEARDRSIHPCSSFHPPSSLQQTGRAEFTEPQSQKIDAPAEPCWVFKLGGSLLNLPGLAERLSAVIRPLSTKPLLVVGGGKAADLVREWDQNHHLDPATAHWLAVRAMQFNQQLIESLLPEAASVSHPEEAAEVWRQNGIAVLNVLEWLQSEESQPETLPHSWRVTSDSIAAWAAVRWRAEGLMLLKSVDLPGRITTWEDAGPGVVDDYFHHLAPKLSNIIWYNLQTGSQEKAASCE